MLIALSFVRFLWYVRMPHGIDSMVRNKSYVIESTLWSKIKQNKAKIAQSLESGLTLNESYSEIVNA